MGRGAFICVCEGGVDWTSNPNIAPLGLAGCRGNPSQSAQVPFLISSEVLQTSRDGMGPSLRQDSPSGALTVIFEPHGTARSPTAKLPEAFFSYVPSIPFDSATCGWSPPERNRQ